MAKSDKFAKHYDELPTRCRNGLLNAVYGAHGITLAQLASKVSYEMLMKEPNLGQLSIKQIHKFFKRHGLALAGYQKKVSPPRCFHCGHVLPKKKGLG